MKEEIIKIAKDLEKGLITEKQAKLKLMVCFDFIWPYEHTVCPECDTVSLIYLDDKFKCSLCGHVFMYR